jgi:hypothetical protein
VTGTQSEPYLGRMVGRAALVFVLAAVTLATAACGKPRAPLEDVSVRVPAESPPSPASWPPYPTFSPTSCWTRSLGGGVLRSAPSVSPSPPHHPLAQETIVQRVLARLGDRRYVLHVALGPPPPITLQHLRGYFAGARPPANARWAYVSAPIATEMLPTHASPQQSGRQMLAQWEAALVEGALRDDFCAAGGAPLVGWTLGRGGIGVSDGTQALGQRFPNPSPADFRRRVQLVGRRYGFTVDELRLLRPRQLAPLLVVRTLRDRTAFVHDIPQIMKLLDPISTVPGPSAITFEGFFFEAIDERGPFARVENVYRGETEGGEWSWNRCVYPYPHSQPFSAKPCHP